MPRQKTEDKFNYVLDYIKESITSRESLKALVDRATKAYKGEPYSNSYKKIVDHYKTIIKDRRKLEEFEKYCGNIQSKSNMTVFNAIETVVSMAMGGASQFEFLPYDKYQDMDPKTIDKMCAAAEHFFDYNKIDALMSQIVKQIGLQGGSYLHIKPSKNKNDASFKVSLIDAYRMLNDPYRNKTNSSRYIGFTQMESWGAVKANVYKTKTGYVLKSINEVDAYLDEVTNAINNGGTLSAGSRYDIKGDLDTFYSGYITMVKSDVNKSPSDKYQYRGDDIEVSYLYDLEENMYFEVVNRKYIIVAKPNPLNKNIKIKYVDSSGKQKVRTKSVSLDSPFVEIPFIKASWETYPVSPLFYVLDDFDSICSIESVIYHNLSIMAPINFIGSSYDAEIISRAAQISGEMIEGVMGQTSVFSKSHDMSPSLSAIARYEERIKRVLGATDQFELQGMIGNRASAQEVSSANGAVSQRLNSLLANIECGMSELANKFFKMYVIFTDNEELSFSYNGTYAEASLDELSSDCIVRGRLKSSIRLEQAQQSRNSLQVIGFLGQNEAINKKTFFGTMIPLAMQGLVSRQQAESFVKEEYQIPHIDIMDSKMQDKLKQDDMDRESNATPTDGIDFSSLTTDELDQAMAKMQQSAQATQGIQTGVNTVSGNTDPIPNSAPGTASDVAGAIANTGAY